MASYTYNKAGSATGTLPDKIVSGDTLRFNVTNSKIDTRYSGTMLTYTFPFDCTVQIDVAGARGGKGNGVGTETTLHGKLQREMVQQEQEVEVLSLFKRLLQEIFMKVLV